MIAKQTKFPISVRLFFESGDPSGICESYMDNFNGIVYRVPRAFINAKSLVNDKLIEDVSLSSSSFAAGFVSGYSRSGNEVWLSADGIKLGDYIKQVEESNFL